MLKCQCIWRRALTGDTFQIELEFENLFFEERGKPEYPEKNLSEKGREPTTNSTHIWRRVRESNPGHIGGRRVHSPLRHPFFTQSLNFHSHRIWKPRTCQSQVLLWWKGSRFINFCWNRSTEVVTSSQSLHQWCHMCDKQCLVWNDNRSYGWEGPIEWE